MEEDFNKYDNFENVPKEYLNNAQEDYYNNEDLKLAEKISDLSNFNEISGYSKLIKEEGFRRTRFNRQYLLDHYDTLTPSEIMATLFYEGRFIALDDQSGSLDKEKLRIRDEFMSSEREFVEELLTNDREFCKSVFELMRKEKVTSETALDIAVEYYKKIEEGTLESRSELEAMKSMTPEEREEAHLKNLVEAEKIMCLFFMMAGDPPKLMLNYEVINTKYYDDDPPSFGPMAGTIQIEYEKPKEIEVEEPPVVITRHY